jgi:hypothetical protein
MDMTRDFINKIQESAAPNEIDYQGRKYVDKGMTALPLDITASPLNTETLTSIVDYIKSNTDRNAIPIENGAFVIHVADYNAVELYKELNADKKRDHLISASIEKCRFQFGQFMPIENFIINLQSAFVQDENTKSLLEFVGSVKDDTSVSQEDDGITQKVTAKTGISIAKTVKAPNPVYLCPFRTFTEIEQPQSAFVFRVRKDERAGVTAALFGADGDAWKHEAILSVKSYLAEELDGQPVIILA